VLAKPFRICELRQLVARLTAGTSRANPILTDAEVLERPLRLVHPRVCPLVPARRPSYLFVVDSSM
jgi:hypothetical protein